MPENGTKQQADQEEIRDLSIQRRAEQQNFISGTFWFGSQAVDEDDIEPWWSEAREVSLDEFWMKKGNDVLQGAIASMVKKFKAMSWLVEGPNRVANRFQSVLAEAEFGKGWSTLLSKSLINYFAKDKGCFWELIGQGDPSGPIEGPVLGVAHLDARMCQLTGDPTYPVIYNNPKTGKPHKLHATRVVHLVDMESPNEAMNGIGFCAVSRVIASSQVLLKLARYKNEKLSDLPEAGLLLLNNILPNQWDDAKANSQRERRRLGHELWQNLMTLFGLDPAQPISAEFISFANLPDQFDEQQAMNIYVNIVALAFGVDTREFWPMSAGPLGTGKETEIQAQKAKGKGVGDLVSTIERAINWKILPPTVSFRFDFQDDEEDEQAARIAKIKTDTIMSMWVKPSERTAGMFESPVSRDEIRQMLADNVPYFKEDFLMFDVTDETELTDTEREKLGPMVQIDHKGFTKRRRRVSQNMKRVSVDSVLERAEENYRAGKIKLDDLMEFRLGQLMDERLGHGQS